MVSMISFFESSLTIYQAKARLFEMEDSQWKERGVGTVRVNTSNDESYSRILFRADQTLILKLNTRIFREMLAEKASDKQVRFIIFVAFLSVEYHILII